MEANGRDTNGHFAPGNPGGPGRPKRLDYRGLCEFIRDRVTERDMEEIIQVALEQAKDGDRYARDFVLKLKRDAVKECERLAPRDGFEIIENEFQMETIDFKMETMDFNIQELNH